MILKLVCKMALEEKCCKCIPVLLGNVLLRIKKYKNTFSSVMLVLALLQQELASTDSAPAKNHLLSALQCLHQCLLPLCPSVYSSRFAICRNAISTFGDWMGQTLWPLLWDLLKAQSQVNTDWSPGKDERPRSGLGRGIPLVPQRSSLVISISHRVGELLTFAIIIYCHFKRQECQETKTGRGRCQRMSQLGSGRNMLCFCSVHLAISWLL